MKTSMYQISIPTFIRVLNNLVAVLEKGAARLAGTEVPVHESTGNSFAELATHIRKTIAQLETFRPEQLDGTEDKTVTWQTRSSTKNMQGLPYLMNHVLPNLFFHTTTAYNILRHNGVELGKMDYLGRS